MTANLCPWKSTWFTKMVKLWLRHIDDNSPRHPYLFETKPFVLSLIKKCYSSDECNFRNNTYALYKLMLSLLWEGHKGFATSLKPRYQILLFQEEKTQRVSSDLSYQLEFLYLETSCLLHCQFQRLRVLYFSFVVHQYLIH